NENPGFSHKRGPRAGRVLVLFAKVIFHRAGDGRSDSDPGRGTVAVEQFAHRRRHFIDFTVDRVLFDSIGFDRLKGSKPDVQSQVREGKTRLPEFVRQARREVQPGSRRGGGDLFIGRG